MTSELAALAGRLCGSGVACAAIRVGTTERLLPGEVGSTSRMTAARLAEFTAGRRAARAAMAQLGRPPEPVPIAADRAPIWPRGIVGSISHDAGLALAAVADTAALRAIGIDIEPVADLPPDALAEVATGPERAWLAAQPPARQGTLARLLFSTKEAAYKAQYPLTGRLVGFDAMTVRLDPDAGRFSVAMPDNPIDGAVGRFGTACGRWLAVLVLRADE